MKSKSCLKSFIAKSVLCSILLFGGIAACAQPVARFSGTTLAGCAPILVHFTDESAGHPNYWRWDLGNGTISYLQNPSVSYFIPGTYNVKLVVKNAAGQDSIVKTNYVQVYAAPVVDFIATQTSGCDTVSTSFSDLSNSANAWQWDFGDGIFSSEQHPSHIYSQTGSYNVSLRAINGEGCSLTLLKQAYINVNMVRANFSHAVADKCTPKKINFQNNSYGNGRLMYKWLFGNGDSSVDMNPVYIYSSGGTYLVQLAVTNEFGCEDTHSYNITVTNPVSASFSANITNSCKAPAAIQFTSQALTNNNYTWDFGDTTFSSAANPVHVFTDTGSYTVKLVIRNSNGCKDSLVKTGYIRIQKPFVSFDNLPDSGCTGLNKHMLVSTASSDSIVNYLWNFGDGTTSNLVNPSHTFNGDRYFNISLVTTGISGCRDTTVMENAIHTGARPVANFSSDVRTACAQTRIDFIDRSQGNVTQWQWNFGDNGQSFEQSPQYRFSDTGFLTAELIAFNGGCTDTATKPRYIYIKPSVSKLKVDFNCENPFVFSFTNLSIGAERWVWDFGDSITSTERNPVHIYTDTGSYFVSLTTYNSSTGCEGYKSKGILTTKVTPGFFASDTILCKGGSVTFTSTLAAADVNRFVWYFGDGTFATTLGNTVTHEYEEPGNYSVSLVTLNRANCRDSVVKANYISVKKVKANFGIPVNVVCAGTNVQFSDSSFVSAGSTIQRWEWYFGDGNTNILASYPFLHSYAASGNYQVRLKITDNYGCSDTYTAGMPVTVKKVYPYFWASDSVKCTGNDIQFINPYAEPGTSYQWDFGDGSYANIQRPRHRYSSEGIYRVKLTITQQPGCTDSFILASPVSILDPVARFSMSDSFSNCPPLIVQFTNESENAIDEVWDFGDGTTINAHNPSHFYSYPGVYTATLTVKGKGGCTNAMQRTITVKGPKGALSYGPLNFCQAPATITFSAITTDATSFTWDFSDGTTVNSTDSVITHQYNNGGFFIPKLMLVDNEGCKVPVQGGDTIRFAGLTAQFRYTDTSVCSDSHILFSNTTSSADSIVNYHWTFGDGSSADNIINPLYAYTAEGTYYPSLSVRTVSGCTDSFRAVIPVRVALTPDVSIRSSNSSGCTPVAISFNGMVNTGVAVSQWQWDFGNGNISADQNPIAQTYTASNNYTVKLTATGSNGCKKTVTKNIEAYPLPLIQITGEKNICKGASTILTASGAASYVWLSADDPVSCISCASTLVSPQATTTYVVTAVSATGCTAIDSITINVAQPISLKYDNTARVCAGSTIQLRASGASVYEWSPSAGLNSTSVSSPAAQPANNIQYKVVGKDSQGCFSDTGFINVQVDPVPTVGAGEDRSVAAGMSIELIPTVSQDVTEVTWSPTGGIFRNADYSITVKPMVAAEYTVLAKNAFGCSATDRIQVSVINEDPHNALFIPNTFSPNADGANDIFYPRAAGSIKINRFKIMSREGTTVFEKTNFYTNDAAAGWDGTYRGTRLLTDIYIYVMEITGADGKPTIIPGNVSLVR